VRETENNQVICKTIITTTSGGDSPEQDITIPGRLRLFAFSAVGKDAGASILFFKNGNVNGEIIANIPTLRNVGWGAYQGLYNFGKDGILFPDGLFVQNAKVDNGTSPDRVFVSASFFYQGA
jgi:hypothetical protein